MKNLISVHLQYIILFTVQKLNSYRANVMHTVPRNCILSSAKITCTKAMHFHCTILTFSIYTHTCRIAAFEESLKNWNPRPEIPDEPAEELPDWMDDLENLGPRVVESAEKVKPKGQEVSHAVKMKAEDLESKFDIPLNAVKINSKPWSSKASSGKLKVAQGKSTDSKLQNLTSKVVPQVEKENSDVMNKKGKDITIVHLLTLNHQLKSILVKIKIKLVRKVNMKMLKILR